MRTALYRHFDAAGQLLYVGISLSAVGRLAQHKLTAHWFAQLARIEVEWLSSRNEALKAERAAIAAENPAHNKQRPQGVRMPVKSQAGSAKQPGWAICHAASGRRDGNYAYEDDAHGMLTWWASTYPSDRFELRRALPGPCVPLRPHDSDEWSVAD